MHAYGEPCLRLDLHHPDLAAGVRQGHGAGIGHALAGVQQHVEGQPLAPPKGPVGLELGDLVLGPGVILDTVVAARTCRRVHVDPLEIDSKLQQQPEHLDEAVRGPWVVAQCPNDPRYVGATHLVHQAATMLLAELVNDPAVLGLGRRGPTPELGRSVVQEGQRGERALARGYPPG